MANTNRIQTKKHTSRRKKHRGLILVASAIAVLCVMVVVLDKEGKATTKIVKGESLIIPVSEVTTDVSFYPIDVDGSKMEVIAVKDSDGHIRTAFNTCEVCYSSGRGYYKQQGDELICQNCGNHFTVDQVQINSGGCNPWPIYDEDKTITDDSIEISYDFLAESKEIFQNWR